MDNNAVKEALKMMPYGFYSITSRAADDVNAMVANWVMQSSFEPRLITVALQKTAYTHDLVERGDVFCVNIFRSEDADLIQPITKGRAKNPEKMAEINYSPGPVTGCPIIEGAAAYLECSVVRIVDVGGDHDLLVGQVVGGDVMEPGEPVDTLKLTDLGWSYAG